MVFPVLAGVLLALSFPPAPMWPLIVPAMALYFYNAADQKKTWREVWWGSFITGGILGLWITYNGLGHMDTLMGASFFSYLVRLSPLLFLVLFGDVFAATALAYRFLLTHSPLFNALLGAALYTAGEMFQQYILNGYYWGSFAHPFAAFPPALTFASLGGTFFVSFLVAFIACIIAQLARDTQTAWRGALILCAGLAVIYAAAVELNPPTQKTGSLSIATVQAIEQDLDSEGSFIAGAVVDHLREAGRSGSNLVVYPYTPTWGIVYAGPKPASTVHGLPIADASLLDIKEWIEDKVAPGSVAVVWPTLYDSSRDLFFKPTLFYKEGKTIAEYRKQQLYLYSDYYPDWMNKLGIVERDSSITAGERKDYTPVGSWRVGNLDCSEIDQPELARRAARASDFLLSIGSDSMFQNGGPADYSLAASRYRAAENHISLLRSALYGPSAIIDPYGAIIKSMPESVGGVLYGTLDYYAPQQTVYNRFGPAPVYAGVVLILLLAIGWKYGKRRHD